MDTTQTRERPPEWQGWLSIREVAESRGVSYQAVHHAIKTGRLRAELVHQTLSGRIYYRVRPAWVEEWQLIVDQEPRGGKRTYPVNKGRDRRHGIFAPAWTA